MRRKLSQPIYSEEVVVTPESRAAKALPEAQDLPASRSRLFVIGSRVLANGFPIALLFGWWLLSRSMPPFIMPDPIPVARKTGELLVGDLAVHTASSLARVIIAVVLALVLGGALVAMGSLVPITDRLVGGRIIPILNSVPALGWAMLGVIWFGVADSSVIFVLTAIVLPFCMVNLSEGMRALDRDLLEMGKSFTRSRLRLVRRIEIPLLLPYAFAALRLSFSVGWKVALIAEFFGSTRGLGLVMNRARQTFDTETVFATIFTVLVIVFVAERLIFEPLSRRFAVRTGAGSDHAT